MSEGGATASSGAKAPGGQIKGGALLLAVLLALGLVVSRCDGGDAKRDAEVDAMSVQLTCKQLVEKRLKNPTTAEYSGEAQTASSASGIVVAENRLGGKVTMTYQCAADGDVVRLISLTER